MFAEFHFTTFDFYDKYIVTREAIEYKSRRHKSCKCFEMGEFEYLHESGSISYPLKDKNGKEFEKVKVAKRTLGIKDHILWQIARSNNSWTINLEEIK